MSTHPTATKFGLLIVAVAAFFFCGNPSSAFAQYHYSVPHYSAVHSSNHYTIPHYSSQHSSHHYYAPHYSSHHYYSPYQSSHHYYGNPYYGHYGNPYYGGNHHYGGYSNFGGGFGLNDFNAGSGGHGSGFANSHSPRTGELAPGMVMHDGSTVVSVKPPVSASTASKDSSTMAGKP